MTQSFQELLTTNYGLLPSGYTGSQGAMGYTGSAGAGSTATGGPKITNIQVTNSSYTVLDDTAVDVSGGYIRIVGTGFESGCTVMINNVPATATTFVGSTEVRAQVPATAAGTYVVYLVNTDGGVAIRINGITFSATPAWSTSSALPGANEGSTVSIQLAAAGASTYSLAAGSSLPGTLTVSSSGLISGTLPGLVNETTYSFTVLATDTELQDSPRTFSITITAGDTYFASTTLLLSGSANTFVRDASANNFAVTVAGDTKPTNFNPYLTGWSNYFDGTGDYLSITNPNTNIGSIAGDFTIECWINWTTAPPGNSGGNERQIIGQHSWPEATTGNWWVISGVNVGIYAYFAGGGSYDLVSSNSFTWQVGTWYHVAVVRSGSTITIYLNGTSVGSGTSTKTLCADNIRPLTISADNDGGQTVSNAHISNLRLVKGTAVYTTNFTPSTTPLTAITGTSLLTCADNRFVDDSTNNLAITRNGDVKIQSFSPFVEPATTNGSAYFDGTGDYLSAGSNSAFSMGTGAFTLEAWVYPTNFTNFRMIFDNRNNVNNNTGFVLGLTGNQGGLPGQWFFAKGAGVNTVTSNTALTLNVWHHIAVVRNSGNTTLYLNGVSVGTGSDSQNYSDNNSLIGITIDNVGWLGYISNLRVVKGTAVYTAAFTPPTQPLTAVANTSLLTLQNNTPVANNTFLDSSSNNFVVTRAGNATQGTFSPYSPSGWSNYFDGTGDYLTHTNISLGSTFTIEFWLYKTNSSSSTYAIVLGDGSYSWISVQEGGLVFSYGGPAYTFAGTFSLNTWNHIAFVNTAGTVSLFINGVKSATTQGGITDWNQSIIGQWGTANTSYPFVGYISNLRMVKGTALYSANFTPSTQPLTAIPGTVLLTCADNRFVDEAPNNFAITRTGDTRVTNFSPFKAQVQTPVSYSAYFDGTGDSLEVPDSASLEVGSTDFTIEAWIYIIASVSGSAVISKGGASSPYLIYQGGGGELSFYASKGAGWAIADLRIASTPSLATWHHIAVSRSGTTFRTFFNGNLANTIELSGDLFDNSSPVSIGTYTGSFNGYISNLRIVKGTAVYTANFTPATAPLTAIAGTSVLTCQSPTFVDNSTNRFAITAVGNSRPVTVNPFGSSFANSTGYTAAEYSGSMYFNGTNSSLTVPTNAAFQLTGNFTVEAWIYPTALSSSANMIIGSEAGSQTDWFGLIPTQLQIVISNSATNWNYTFSTNTWYHVAVARSGTNLTAYVNGVSLGTNTRSEQFLNTGSGVMVGRYGFSAAYWFTGYISDLRIAKGTALYTSSFVPPAAPVLLVQNTVLLLNGTSAAITDTTTKNDLETVGDAKISTAVSKFGGSSMAFDGSGDYLSIPATPTNRINETGNFTIEFWAYFNTVASNQRLIAWDNDTTNFVIAMYTSSSGVLSYYLSSAGNTWNVAAQVLMGNITTSTWYHIALVRNGSVFTPYINGVAGTTTTSNATLTTSTLPLVIGATSAGTSPFNGYIQDFRITKGVARYTATFTPPATAFIAK